MVNLIGRNRTRMTAVASVVLVAMLLAVPASPAVEESEAFSLLDMPGFAIGFGVGFILGWLANDYVKGTGPVYDSEKLAADLREEQAEWITTSIEDASITVGNAMSMASESWRFTNSYWERLSEVAVADQWTANGSMDTERILELSGLRYNSSTVQYNWALLSDAVPDKFSHQLETYQEANAYGAMRLGLVWDNGSMFTDGTLTIKYGAGTIVSGAMDDRVYIDNRSHMYVFGGNARIESSLGSYVLVAGENNISTIPSGVYELQSDRMYVGGLAYVIAEDAADINAGLTAMSTSATVGAVVQNGAYAVWSGVNRYVSDTLAYGVKHESNAWKAADLGVSLSGYQSFLDEICSTMVRSTNAAQVMWMVFDAAGSSTNLISPAAIMPQLENLNFTAEQQYLVYLSAMKQIGDWYSRSSSSMQLDDLTVCPQSLELVCRGAIYNQIGEQVVGDDAVWTPVVYLRDQAVPVGESTWMQTGLVMVWGTASSLDGWESDGTAMRLVEVSPGYSFDVEEMKYQGNGTDLVVLEVTSYTEWAQIDLTPIPDSITPPESVSIYLIIAIAALLVAAAFVTGRYKGRGKVETIVVMKDARVQQERRRMDKARRR